MAMPIMAAPMANTIRNVVAKCLRNQPVTGHMVFKSDEYRNAFGFESPFDNVGFQYGGVCGNRVVHDDVLCLLFALV